MPIDPNIQQQAQQYFSQKGVALTPKKQPTYAEPLDIEKSIDSMPNANKLTDTERWVYKALPGISSQLQGFSDAMDKFDKWAFGVPSKLLTGLDVLAEGLERSAGVLVQMRDPNFDFKDLKAAWYAGSLTYETANGIVPIYAPEKFRDPITGKVDRQQIVGFNIQHDLPGTQIGLSDARAEISQLISQGYTPKAALEKARDNYYNGLGALALRAQINDTIGHVFGDPLNLLTAYFKPLQLLKAKRYSALSKITLGATDLISESNRVSELAKSALKAEDAFALTNEAYLLAQASGDVAKASSLSDEAVEIAKQLGKTGDVERLLTEGAELKRIAGSADEAVQYTERALQDLGKKQLTVSDKVSIFLTGGDPFRPTKVGQALRKLPIIGAIGKAFELTPASKAQELLNLVGDNIGANLISRVYHSANAEKDFVAAIHRIKNGATGIEYGHSLLTQQGKTVQGFLSGSDFNLQKLLANYEKLAPQRQQLALISNILGDSPASVLSKIADNPEAVMRMITGKDPLIDEFIRTGQLNQDVLGSFRRMFPADGSVPYNKDMFFATALDEIETAVMRQAVMQFGIKAKGVLTRWSDALKTAESLAFLRLNPAYPVRNVINNEITMIARGLFGVIDDAGIDDFWKGFGFNPKQLDDLGIASETVQRMSKAEMVLEDALRGGKMSLPDKAKEFFQSLNLGKLDTANFSAQFERKAGRRAMTLGTQQYIRKYNKPIPIQEYLNPALSKQIDELDPVLRTKIDAVIRSAGAIESKLDELTGKNLNISIDSILDDVTQRFGQDAREVLGDEMLEFLHQKLPSAIESGSLDSFKVEARQLMDSQVENLFQKQIDNIIENTESQFVAGGANVWSMKLGEAQDVIWGANMEHAIRIPETTKLAREAAEIGDYKTARALWEQEFLDSKNVFNRAFRRADAYMEGLERGSATLKERGVNLPFSKVRNSFTQWKGVWEDFYSTRSKLYDDFFKAFESAPKGSKPSFDDVRSQMSRMFDEAIAKENKISQNIDDTITAMLPNDLKQPYMTARDELARLIDLDKQEVKKMFDMDFDNGAEKQAAWNLFWQQRTQRIQEMRNVDTASIMIQQGDETAIQAFTSKASEGEEFNIFRMANEYGVASATEGGARNDRRVLATINKYLPEGMDKFKNVVDVPEDIARQAFETRALEKGLSSPVSPSFIADVKKVVPPLKPIDLGMEQQIYGRIQPMLDNVVRGAQDASKQPPLLLKNLPENLQVEIQRALRNVKNDFSTARYKAIKFGEWRREAALLNYRRRTNFDNWLGHIAPFGFWTTNSMFKWAIESIDRPAMLTNYLRTKRFFETSGLSRDGQPSRTKGKIRVDLPFAPDWMGEQFIDPLRMILPFDNWIQPFEQVQREQEGVEGRTERVLDQLLEENKISQEEYNEALESRSGSTWDYASAIVSQNQDGDNYDAWDFATSLQAPHAPIMWAYNAAFGDVEDIPSFTPLSRLTRNAVTVLGLSDDWNNSKWNLEAKIRRQLGLNSFDKWDDYRIDRSLVNLGADGKYSPDEISEAMAISALVQQGQMTVEQAKEQSEAYNEGVKRANQEFTGGGSAFVLGLFGLGVTTVPEGESDIRALQDDFALAYQKEKKAEESFDAFLEKNPTLEVEEAGDLWEKKYPTLAKDADALKTFFDAHPEYENRLALFDKPEERIHKFYVDEVWKKYNSLPTINKEEARNHLGTDFQQTFLDNQTRSYEDIPTEVMAVWLKMMNIDPLGGLTADQRMLVSLYGKVQFTEPETAWRVEAFYDQREKYNNWYELQSRYYELPKNKRQQFKNENPELQQYWDFRQQFFYDNPDIVPYITDSQSAIDKAKRQTRTENAVPTLQEIQVQISPALSNIIQLSGGDLPPVAERELEYIAKQNGMELETLMGMLGLQ